MQPFESTLLSLLPIFVVARLAVFLASGVYDIRWSEVSARDAVQIFKGLALSAVVLVALTYLFDWGRLPRSIFIIDFCLLGLLLGLSRLGLRLWVESSGSQDGVGCLVYGTGESSRQVAKRLHGGSSVYSMKGYLANNSAELGKLVSGISVLASLDDIENLLEEASIFEILVPEELRSELPSVMEALSPLRDTRELAVKIIKAPSQAGGSADELLARKESIGEMEIRSPLLTDLLGRDKWEVDARNCAELVCDRTVMITGAGGTIGRELARQVVELGAATVVLLDNSELQLFETKRLLDDLNFARGLSATKYLCHLCDVKNIEALEELFNDYLPEIVFHAAAYKHVFLGEETPYEFIDNNVGGTSNIVELSAKYNVERLVNISTDKAVKPMSIMGMTKRLCELVVAESSLKASGVFCSVRFGNVLGSSGSLIPILTSQLLAKKPLTLRHPQMSRYFMLVEEAVSLVLRSASLARRGEIAVLDMGEPVRIVDIAKNLRLLMGRSEKECPIVYTGASPGEKLSEELYSHGEPSAHERIFILPDGDSPRNSSSVSRALSSWSKTAERILVLARARHPRAETLLREQIGWEGATEGWTRKWQNQ